MLHLLIDAFAPRRARPVTLDHSIALPCAMQPIGVFKVLLMKEEGGAGDER